MKNKNKILIIGFIGVLIGGFSALAAGSSVSVSPASLSKNVGQSFNLSVGLNAGEKVCAVEGRLNLNNLSCQSISVDSGVMAQSSPSCSNPYFLIGIPGCTTVNKTLFTVNVKGISAGAADAAFSGVDIIGEGISLGSASLGGSYTLIVPSAPSVPPATPSTPPSTPSTPPTTPPAQEEVKPTVPSEEGTATTAPKEVISNKELPSNVAGIGLIMNEITQSAWKVILIIFCLIVLIIVGVKEWKIIKNKKKG